MQEKFREAEEAKRNDIRTFEWKYKKQPDGTQPTIKLVDASIEQLSSFYHHCKAMLYNEDKNNPGRYLLLSQISEQRKKCNIELFLRKLESGELCADGRGYKRFLYLQDIRACLAQNKEIFPSDKLGEITIDQVTNGLPREFSRISISDVMDGALDNLGMFVNKHITFTFILNMGVHLTPDEKKEFTEYDENGVAKKIPEVIKSRLNINPNIILKLKPQGLSYTELRAMVTLKPKKYSELTTDQLMTLRNKVLFKLENEVQYHISQWEEKIRQLRLVAEKRGMRLMEQDELV